MDFEPSGPAGVSSLEITFPTGSTASNVVVVSQDVTVCPGQAYGFVGYATAGQSDAGICKVWWCVTPEAGAKKCTGANSRTRLFDDNPTDQADSWAPFELEFFNSNLLSLSVTIEMHAYCTAPKAKGVRTSASLFIDSVSVTQ
ncbi:hypothetical protein BDZ45DRAFT_177912 [Acephala macrosclerotiorum]|nr:hypothetical protein BDZ45DRAFT_177912 [Acephala macrosclerotiorum]